MSASVWDRLYNASTDSSHQKQYANRRPIKTPFNDSLRNQKENSSGSTSHTTNVKTKTCSDRTMKTLATKRTSTLFLSRSHAPDSFAKLKLRSLTKELIAYEQGNVSATTVAGHILEALLQRDIMTFHGNDPNEASGSTDTMATSVQQIAHKVFRVTSKQGSNDENQDNKSDMERIAQARIRFAPAEILVEGYSSSSSSNSNTTTAK